MDENLRSKFLAALENEILLGQQSGTIVGLQERSATAKGNRLEQDERQSRKIHLQNTDFIQLIEQIRIGIESLQREIEELEYRFQAKDGDAWREKLALKILSPDEIPQQKPGESIENYRTRLEAMLIAKMLDENGKIKARYLDDPALLIYAQWAQKKFNLNLAKDNVAKLEDPATSPEQQQEILHDMNQRGDMEELTFASREATTDVASTQVKNTADEIEDHDLDTASRAEDLSQILSPIR